MSLAVEDAGLDPSAVNHVNAHGTSTPLNDAAESEAVAKVFGGSTPPITSIKGVTGHTIGAAGAVEAVASLLSLRHGLVPPVANYETPDPEITADVVHGAPREIGAGVALSNSFGFGGHNASLVLGLV
jgi:3-oxoacyl-[acyl-carrier-protein] synthase II